MLLHVTQIATTVPNLMQGERLSYKADSNTNLIMRPYILEACASWFQDSSARAEASACGWRRRHRDARMMQWRMRHRDARMMQWPGCVITWNALGVCFASSAVLATVESMQQFKSLSTVRFNARTPSCTCVLISVVAVWQAYLIYQL